MGKIIHPRKKPFIRPRELLSTSELGDLWLEVAAKGRELERKEMEETIKSLDNISVGDLEADPDKVWNDALELFPEIPEDVTLIESEDDTVTTE